jgi:hypothetical protein
MFRRLLPLFAIAALILTTYSSWARSDSTVSLRTTINLQSTVSVNNKTLEPGVYTVVAEGNQAKFERDGKVIAEAPCTFKTLSSKAAYTEVRMDRDRITEIDLSGKTQAIEFPANQSAGN